MGMKIDQLESKSLCILIPFVHKLQLLHFQNALRSNAKLVDGNPQPNRLSEKLLFHDRIGIACCSVSKTKKKRLNARNGLHEKFCLLNQLQIVTHCSYRSEKLFQLCEFEISFENWFWMVAGVRNWMKIKMQNGKLKKKARIVLNYKYLSELVYFYFFFFSSIWLHRIPLYSFCICLADAVA